MKRTGLAGIVLVLAACGGGGGSLADRDPQGAQACDALTQAIGDLGDTDAATDGLIAAGTAAEQSETAAIRDAVVEGGGFVVADPEAMTTACRDEGQDVPDIPEG